MACGGSTIESLDAAADVPNSGALDTGNATLEHKEKQLGSRRNALEIHALRSAIKEYIYLEYFLL